MENPVVNNSPVTPASPAEAPVTTPAAVVTPAPTQPPGSKTDPALLLKSLQEERERNRQLEAELAARAATPHVTDDIVSDEGRAIVEKFVKPLQETVTSLTEELQLNALYAKYPLLKEAAADFASYRQGFPGVALENVAKAFLAEKGLVSADRKGLESPSGGTKTPTSTGITAEEVAELRVNNYPKYLEMIRSGQIDPKQIK